MYAKTVLEGLRVLYVSPNFQARPAAPATASATVKTGKRQRPDDTATYNPGSTGTVS